MVHPKRPLPRKLALGAAAVAAGTMILVDGRVAWADPRESVATHEFDIGPGVTCTIEVSSWYDDEDHFGRSRTRVVLDETAPDERCGDADAFVAIDYTDTGGSRERVMAWGRGGYVRLDVEDAASDYSAQHYVQFRYCQCGTPTYITTPK